MPYTTTQHRVTELEWVDLVEGALDEASKRAVKLVRLVNFRIELSPGGPSPSSRVRGTGTLG